MINKLRELANNATQVKWSWDGRSVDDDGDVYIPECSYLVGNICLADQYEGYVEDCDFIAAANPIAIRELIQQRDELLAALKALIDDVQGLIRESDGVAGLHLNGEIAPWRDVEAGGFFERLSSMPFAIEAIAKAESC